MAAIISALMRVRRTQGGDLLPDSAILQELRIAGVRWRERMLTPLVVVRLFLIQILFGNTAITQLRQLCGKNFSPSSYCEARLRLPLFLLRRLLRWTVEQSRQCGQQACLGVRVFVVDCSSFSMPDTPALRKQFGLPRSKGRGGKGCLPGVAYPVAKIMALMDLASGCVVRLIPGALYRHEASNVIRVHRQLKAGDILLGDRAFCSFVHVALLGLRGVAVCFRLHHRRKSVSRGIETWKRPTRPTWMHPGQFATLPTEVKVRIVRYTLRRKGYRPTCIAIATTLHNERLWPDEQIAELYACRWNIETCFDHLKTTMNMNVLKCKSMAGIYRELMMYLIVYNLIRLAMLRFAMEEKLPVDRISFIDAMRYLSMRAIGLRGVAQLWINIYRPGRQQPRVIRRRMKEYDLLTKPRAEWITPQNQA
jgi:hypothetical protein